MTITHSGLLFWGHLMSERLYLQIRWVCWYLWVSNIL